MTVKRAAILACYLLALAGAWRLRSTGHLSPEAIIGFTRDYPLSAPLLFCGAYAACVALMAPTLPLNLAAGLVWGPLYGGVLSALGSGGGAILAFAVARFIFGEPFLQRLDSRMLGWFLEQLDRHTWKVMLFIRFNPVLPGGPVNFLFAFTPIRFTTYSVSSLVLLMPPSIAFAWVGHSAGSYVLDPGSSGLYQVSLALLGVAGFVLASHFATRRLMKSFKKTLES